MSKNQQKTVFNTAAGEQNSLAGAASNSLGSTNSDLSSAGGAYSALGPSGVSNILAPATGAATNVSNTGGYSQPQLNTLEGQESSNLGGLDPNALSALSGQYQDLISSGGISDATAAAMQRQAVSGVSSLYGTLNNQQQRTQAATGGQGGGGQTAEMARQLGQSEANAVTGVNAQVGQLRQQGTEAGLSGGSNLAASQAAAQNAAANAFSGTQSGVASGVQTGANLLSGLGSTALSGDLASAGGLTNVAGLQSNLYGTQLAGQQGLLGSESGIANAQQGAFGNILNYTKAVGGLAGAAFGGCWIAEATYGIDDPRTHTARAWLNGEFRNTLLGNIVMTIYIAIGQQVAWFVRRSKTLQKFFKIIFDKIPGVKECQ
jgi:hypothetical protein